MSHLQEVFEGLCADLGFNSQSSEEAERIWDALRAVSGLLRFNHLVKLSDQLSRAVIANEVRPTSRSDIWELALRIREELSILEVRPRLPPIAREQYQMRDALWDLKCSKGCGNRFGVFHPTAICPTCSND
jgi:hypothetical protein